jgi:hypothetical protein
MIDTLALALGHGLMAVALMRLLLRAGLDEDPLLEEIAAETSSKQQATSAAGRAAARRALSDDDAGPDVKGPESAE